MTYALLSGEEPFADIDDATAKANNQHVKYAFDAPVWEHVSIEAKDFIQRCFQSTAEDRINPEECKQHPWLREFFTAQNIGVDPFEGFSATPTYEAVESSLLGDRVTSVQSEDSFTTRVGCWIEGREASKDARLHKFEGNNTKLTGSSKWTRRDIPSASEHKQSSCTVM